MHPSGDATLQIVDIAKTVRGGECGGLCGTSAHLAIEHRGGILIEFAQAQRNKMQRQSIALRYLAAAVCSAATFAILRR
jgi:hypothetical protein